MEKIIIGFIFGLLMIWLCGDAIAIIISEIKDSCKKIISAIME